MSLENRVSRLEQRSQETRQRDALGRRGEIRVAGITREAARIVYRDWIQRGLDLDDVGGPEGRTKAEAQVVVLNELIERDQQRAATVQRSDP